MLGSCTLVPESVGARHTEAREEARVEAYPLPNSPGRSLGSCRCRGERQSSHPSLHSGPSHLQAIRKPVVRGTETNNKRMYTCACVCARVCVHAYVCALPTAAACARKYHGMCVRVWRVWRAWGNGRRLQVRSAYRRDVPSLQDAICTIKWPQQDHRRTPGTAQRATQAPQARLDPAVQATRQSGVVLPVLPTPWHR